MTEAGSAVDVAGVDRPGDGPPREDLRALTGLRFFAAAAVVVFHFRFHLSAIFPATEPWEPIAAVGDSGVDLFFVLSGFIISYNYAARFRVWNPAAYREFLVLRLARMYPVHLVTLLLLGAVVLVARYVLDLGHVLSSSDLGNFLQQLFLVVAWRPDDDNLSWNYPAWSISAEWFAYLLFPFLVLVTGRLRSAWSALLAAAVVLGVYAAATDVGERGGALPRVLCEFLAGVLLATVFTEMRTRRLWDVLALGTTVLGLALVVLADGRFQAVALVYVFAALVLFLSRARGPFAAFLAWGPVVVLGEASYSLYMTHGIVDLGGQLLLPMEDFAGASLSVRVVVVLVHLLVLVVATAAVYRLVEKPGRRWVRARALPRVVRPPATAVAGPAA